jgi:hypothetical protein
METVPSAILNATGTFDTLQVCCYDGSDMGQIDFAEWFGKFRTPSGKKADADSMDTLIELCGTQIGRIHTPSESASASDIGWVFVGVDTRDGLFKCYAAARLTSLNKTLVIDLLGVHESIRRRRAGGTFYHAVMTELRPRIAEHIGTGTKCLVSLQSTFDYDSYVRAVLIMASVGSDTAKSVTFSFDKDQIIKRLSGACRFWRSVGFSNSRLVFTNESIVAPILIMWQEI